LPYRDSDFIKIFPEAKLSVNGSDHRASLKIGKGSVIAAGSVVTGDVPENTLITRNPAKIVKTNIYWAP
jgi:bifunctional N-acetylglucosamine-1-phosphate-uridyltransferase/glucosamine-1-phosphate-acetyltransferase GlmU-like protein